MLRHDALTFMARFRLVSCQMEELGTYVTPGELKQTLKRLPKTLGQIYERILERIHNDHYKYVLQVLQWLAFSARPLKLRELAAALAVDLGDVSVVNDADQVP